jgi:hypothetical protein
MMKANIHWTFELMDMTIKCGGILEADNSKKFRRHSMMKMAALNR